MKFHTISFVAAFSAVALLGSCSRSGEPVGRNKLYLNATDTDSEAFTFLKTVHEKAVFETELAKYVASTSASSEAKTLAADVVKTYDAIIPELEELAATFHVVLPSPGMPAFVLPDQFLADSLASFDNAAYAGHVQHEQEAIRAQFERLSRNTISELRVYANEKLPAVKTLFAAAGGEEDHGAHH
ncbi:DUF4142 domain-containing protein [Parapedobacter pyrenivorans]|nr:DUF4142 domain-containing protein [Parapedobacter pyrenivorans]